ncbi:glycosyltransferase family 4 protein [Mesorhizobium sp. RMAD-H1]|uniref:glycosyltransferase family 4 protein n=1 Tax=Mesorhizobium sp. RMAD-H1 TaxID=2587065 RepID=UPI00181A55B2|nr:glycosyltransferase family 4 protein [Mesorhizobium sp. RMAD-H1]MBB2972361.1 glycosyltransferase involved in cell wall biosynthesis [Mesorhizobium sp. RMAD-H1]
MSLSAFSGGTSPHTALRPGDRELRVLMTVDAVGGVWRYAMDCAGALREQGVSTVFAGLGPQPTPEQREEAEEIGELVWLDQPLDWMAEDERELEAISPVLEQLADDHRIDILHLNLPSQAVGIRRDIPVVAVSHSCLATWWETMRTGPLPDHWLWHRRRNAEGFSRADAIVTPSRSHAEAVARSYGTLPRLSVVPNGTAARFDQADKQPFVFAAGRWWDDGKNVSVLDAAAGKSAWPIHLAGPLDGPNGQTIILHHARSLGSLPHSQVLGLVQRAGIVVSPSLYEPFGLAALEGARAGAALILSDIPVYRELWDEAAIFFDPAAPDRLVEAVDLLAGDPQLRRRMGERAFTRSLDYTPERQARDVAAIYRGLVSPPARQSLSEA